MKKLAYLCGALLASLSVVEAQSSHSMVGELGSAGQAGALVPFGRYTCPGSGSCFDPKGNLRGELGAPVALGATSASASARRGIFGQIGGQARDTHFEITGWRLGRFGQAKAPISTSALIDVGPRDASTSSGSSQRTFGSVRGPGRDGNFQTSGRRLGRVGQAGTPLDISALIDVGQRDPSSQAAARRQVTSRGIFGQAGHPERKPSDARGGFVGELDDPTIIHPARSSHSARSLQSTGKARQIQLGPLPAIRSEEEPSGESAPIGQAQKVVLYGRSATAYALSILPMGSANAPAILVAQGMLFGDDPSEEPRSYVLRVPAEFAVLLVPIQ